MKLRLYHSSNVAVKQPDILHSRPYLDFGKGFYLTSIYGQAEKYALRFIRRGQPAWLSEYDLEIDTEGWKIKVFNEYDKEWLLFVSKCRAGEDVGDYDLIIGGVADDRVIQTIDRYFRGEIDEDYALGELKYEKPNNQYCIRSQTMLDNCLTHITSKRI